MGTRQVPSKTQWRAGCNRPALGALTALKALKSPETLRYVACCPTTLEETDMEHRFEHVSWSIDLWDCALPACGFGHQTDR